MNYVKKSVNNRFVKFNSVFFLISILVLSACSCKKQIEEKVIITEKNSYVGIGEKDAIINVSCYIDDTYSFLLDKEQILSCSIIDRSDESEYLMEIVKVENNSNSLEYNSNTLICKVLSLKFNYITDEIIKIPSATLEFNYNNGKEITLDIGSVVFMKENDIYNFNLVGVKGIVNDIIPASNQMKLSTVALIIRLRSLKNQTIKQIELLNGYGEIKNNQITEFDNYDIDNQTDIKSILDYELLYKETSYCDIIFQEEEIKTLILPISYYKLETIYQAGLIITTETGEKHIIHEFPIFSSNAISNSYSKYVFD